MNNTNMFSPLVAFKVLWWKTDIKLRKQLYKLANHKHVVPIFYLAGIVIGWVLCSEWQIYLQTGEVTLFPWE